MRTYRFAVLAVALAASTALISCSSDDDAPANSGPPVVADSTISTTATLPIPDTSIDDTTDQTVQP
jgi:hypothetical protein